VIELKKMEENGFVMRHNADYFRFDGLKVLTSHKI
jgi:hypothetical protein